MWCKSFENCINNSQAKRGWNHKSWVWRGRAFSESTYFCMQQQPNLEAFTLCSRTQWSPFHVVTSGYIPQQCFVYFPASMRPHCIKNNVIFYFFLETQLGKEKGPKSQQDHVVWHVTANSASNVTFATMSSPTHQPWESPSLLSPLFWSNSIFLESKMIFYCQFGLSIEGNFK